VSWEAITAIGSLLTVVVIAVSAIFALRNVTQLRRAAQLDGTMRIFAEFSDPEFIAARSFVLGALPERLKDPSYAEELKSYRNVDIAKHPEYRVLLFLQLVGSLVKNHLVDGPGVYEFAQYSIVKSWEVLDPVVRMQRESTNNPYMWATADFLYENTKQWLEQNSKKKHIVSPATGELFHAEDLR
jgi:hypothetical protein